MAGGVGNLTVGLGLDYAAYTAGLTKAQRQAEQFATNFKASFAGNLAAGFTKDIIQGLAQIPGRLVDVVKGAIDAADHLNDLSKKTGIAADTLGGIGFAAKQAGGDLDSAAAGIGKLNKSIAEAAAGGKEAAEAFSVIGVAVKDASGATRNADAVLSDVADKFASYADGPEKAALALKLFGKAGADMIPLLDEGGRALQDQIAYFKRYSGVTVETAKAADEFNDTLTKINLLSQSFSTTLAAALLPTLQTLADRFLAAKEQGQGFAGVADTIASVFKGLVIGGAYVIDTFGGVGREIGAIAAQLAALARFDFKGFTAIGDAVKADGAQAKKELDAFVSQVLNPTLANAGPKAVPGVKGPAPRLSGSGGGAVDDPTRKLLEARLKAIDSQIDQEKDLFQTRNRFLDLYNNQNLLSIQDYYAGRTAAQSEALRTESALIDQEIALVREHQGIKGLSKKDQAADEVKVQELIGRRTKLEQQAGEQTIFLAAQRQRDYEQLADQILGVSANVLELRENFALAAAVRFDLQFDALSKTFTANGNAQGLEAIKTLRAAAIAQGAFQKASLDSSRTLDDLQRAEERIATSVLTGARTSIDALVAEGEARRKMLPALEAQVAAQEAIAKAAQAAGTAGATDLVAKADAARVALERLKATADPVALAINKALGDDFESALTDFVTGTKTASEAFKSFAKSVLNDILKLGSKNISESIFGGSGGIGKFISDLANSGGSSSSSSSAAAETPTASALAAIQSLFADSGATAAKAAEAASTTAATTAVTAMAASATAASAALTTLASASALSSAGNTASSAGDIASLFSDFGGFFASGGDIKPGQWGVVGENGPELAFGGNAGKTIQPATMGGNQRTNYITVNVPPNAGRDYGTQVGADVARQLAIADRRNN